MADLEVVGLDLETARFGPGCLAPRPICLAVVSPSVRMVLTTADAEFDDALVYALENVWTNAFTAFDAAVVCEHRPQLRDKVFKAYREGRITDVVLREKLLVLATNGRLDFVELADGTNKKRIWKLSSLEQQYLGVDRSADKDEEDSWRFHYDTLEGKPASEYTEEQSGYVFSDADNVHQIHRAQDQLACQWEQGAQHPFTTEGFQARAEFALYLQSCVGLQIDQDYVHSLRAHFDAEFADDRYPAMLKAGVLRRADPGRPHRRHEDLARGYLALPSKAAVDWTLHREMLEKRGVLFTAAKKSSVNETGLKALVEEVCVGADLEVAHTETGQVALNAEALSLVRLYHPVIDEYMAREEISTLVGSFLPNLDAPIVHPKFNALVESGRTSSFGNKKGKKAAYPAINGQNVDPRCREVVVAPEGSVICSVDFDYLELVSAAQKCLTLFGKSELANAINGGRDPHADLATSIAELFDEDFAKSCSDAGLRKHIQRYEAFKKLNEIDKPTYKHWRTMAKPTGLGFWGGLGAVTFIAYARSTFGVDLIQIAGSIEAAIELAEKLKEIWFERYPEAEAFFDWVNTDCKDLEWSSGDETRYQYVSPLGMIRRNCTYCSATNGIAMQTAAAEGAKQAVWRVAEACWDETQDSCLYGVRPFLFVHDQIMVYMPLDGWEHERAHEMARIMRQAMQEILPDVKVGASPVLMLRWNKDAETVVDHNGRLQIWHPKEAA